MSSLKNTKMYLNFNKISGYSSKIIINEIVSFIQSLHVYMEGKLIRETIQTILKTFQLKFNGETHS